MNSLFSPSALRKCGSERGAILVEVLISLVIFTIGITAAFSLLINSSNISSMSKNRIVAVNLAREGTGVVRNIRDTNWLIYSADMRECWNFSPDSNENGNIEPSPSDTCVPNNDGQNTHPIGKISTGQNIRSLIADYDSANLRWLLLPADEYPDESSTPEQFVPYDGATRNGEVVGDDITPASFGNRNTQLGIADDGRYTHDADEWVEPSRFHRIIDICYLDNVTNDCTGTDGLFPDGEKQLDNRLKITAKVYWKERPNDDRFRSTQVETILTDYRSRSDWND